MNKIFETEQPPADDLENNINNKNTVVDDIHQPFFSIGNQPITKVQEHRDLSISMVQHIWFVGLWFSYLSQALR
jgi:hypothetical protein